SPLSVPEIVSIRLTLVFLPAASVRSTWYLRVRNRWSPSTRAEATGSTLPQPQSILASSFPFFSSTPSQPAAPPGMVKAHWPANGFSAAMAASVAPAIARQTNLSEYFSVVIAPLCFCLKLDASLNRRMGGQQKSSLPCLFGSEGSRR